MNNFLLGEYIRRKRLDLGLTQEEVCDGICEPITLSRIENNKQTPGRNRINAILERLGLPADRYYALLTSNEIDIESLKKDIISCNVTKNVQECRMKIIDLEKKISEDDNLTKQFILRTKIIIGHFEKSISLSDELDLLIQAIKMTVPRFDINEIERGLYTVEELKIINQIGITYSNLDENRKAADIYYQLLRYIRKHIQEVIISSGIIPLILFNYARILDLSGRYDEGFIYAHRGQEACVKYGHYQCLPGCLAIKAECAQFLHNDADSQSLYRQAYYLYCAIGDLRNKANIENEAKKYHKMSFND